MRIKKYFSTHFYEKKRIFATFFLNSKRMGYGGFVSRKKNFLSNESQKSRIVRFVKFQIQSNTLWDYIFFTQLIKKKSLISWKKERNILLNK